MMVYQRRKQNSNGSERKENDQGWRKITQVTMKSKTLTKFFEIHETYCSSFFARDKKNRFLTYLFNLERDFFISQRRAS